MRVARRCVVRPEGGQFFHVMSRVVEKRHIFGVKEKDLFLNIMKQLECFSGVEVMTYCIMGNHFHIIVFIPDRNSFVNMDAAEVFRRISHIYPRKKVESEKRRYECFLENGFQKQAENQLNNYIKRMCCLTSFLKDLKQRFTQKYNSFNGRKGNLWEERFKSVLIGAEFKILQRFMKYVDLNPVRAGMVKDPFQYKWSGIGEYARGVKKSMLNFKEISCRLGGPRLTLKAFAKNYRRLILMDSIASPTKYEFLMFHSSGDPAVCHFNEEDIKKFHHSFQGSLVVGSQAFLNLCSRGLLIKAGIGFFKPSNDYTRYTISDHMRSEQNVLKMRSYRSV